MAGQSLVIGATRVLNEEIPKIDERAIRREELGMRKDEHALRLSKAKREEELMKAIAAHVDEYRNAVANMPAGPAIGGGVPQQPQETPQQPQAQGTPAAAPKVDEAAFQQWYSAVAGKQGLNPNPDDPQHFYDYRAAYAAGASPDATGHWPSQFKMEGHPNLIVNGVNTKTGETISQEATISGAPNLDSGSAITIQNPSPQQQAPQQQAIPGPVELQANDPVTRPPQNPDALMLRGEMMMKIHDTLLANGQFDAANKIQKAEFDNIFQIAKLSPQGAMKAWNSNPWITKIYGQIKPGDFTQKGEWSFLKYGGDGLVRWNKNGAFEVVQKPTGTGGKQPSLSMYVEKPIGPNQQQKFQWNPQTGQHDIPFGAPYRIHKPDGSGVGGGGGAGDAREFRMHMGQLNGLYKSMANIQKGVDPITQQVIPQDQIEAAKGTIQGQINSLESLMQEDYPDQWAKYRKQPKAKGGVIGGNQDYKANKTYNVGEAADYFRENTGKYSQKAMYDKLKASGYSDDSIKQAWKQFKGVQ